MAVKLQLRRGTTAEWSAENPVLAEGEIGIDTTARRGKIGDGSTAWNSLAYGFAGTPGTLNVRGAWSGSSVAYVVDDIVDNDGSSYFAAADHTSGASTEPGVGASWATVWQLLAAKGDPGAGDMIAANNLSDVASAGAARDNLSVPSRASTIKTVADRTALKAEDVSEHTFFWLDEAGREGLFMWTTGDKSSAVSADAQEGITIAHGTIASTTGAFERFLTDGLRPEWFGAAGDNGGTIGAGTDDTTALLACLARCLSLRREMRLSKYYRYNPSAVVDLTGENWGLLIRGDKRNGCGFVLDATKALEIEGANSFYHHIADLQVIGNVAGPVVRIGKNDFSDAFNDFNMERIVINNISTDSAMEGLRLNYVLASRIHATVNGGGTGRASASSGAGKAVVLRQCAFNNFVLHCGQANIGLSIQDGTSFANTFYGIDIEEVGKAVSITSASASGNKFLAGQFLGYVTFDCTAGDNNWFSNAANRVNYGGGLGSNLTGLVLESLASGLVTYQTGTSAVGVRLTNNTTSFDQSLSGANAFFTNYGGSVAFTAGAGNITLTATGGTIIAAQPLRLPSFTVATLPSASTAGAGAMIFVTDETGGATPAFSDGTDWRRVSDRAIAA